MLDWQARNVDKRRKNNATYLKKMGGAIQARKKMQRLQALPVTCYLLPVTYYLLKMGYRLDEEHEFGKGISKFRA